MHMMMTKRQRLTEDLDNTFSEYMRLVNADEYGHCVCISCPTRRPWHEMHCAHYHGRYCMMLRRYPKNCGVACPECNTARPEQHIEGLKAYLIQEHGEDVIDELDEMRNEVANRSLSELKKMLTAYRKKVRDLKKQL